MAPRNLASLAITVKKPMDLLRCISDFRIFEKIDGICRLSVFSVESEIVPSRHMRPTISIFSIWPTIPIFSIWSIDCVTQRFLLANSN